MDIHDLMHREVKIGEKEGEITNILGTQFLEITFFDVNEERIPICIDEIDKYLV